MSSGGALEAAEILVRPPEEGARRLALSYLDQAAAARPRLDDAADDEALHDLRVALRRLRSCLRAFDGQLGESVPKKLAKRLKRLAEATGPGRDAEVQLAWVRKHARELGSAQRSGHGWLANRLQERMDKAYGKLREELGEEFATFEAAMRRRLSVYRAEVRLDGGAAPAFGEVAAALLDQHAEELARRLRKVHDPAGVDAAHQARIAAKRLRYLADPLVQLFGQALAGQPAEPRPDGALTMEGGAAPAAKGAVLGNLKDLQDLLGELHDAHVLEEELAEAIEDAAAERAGRLFALALDADGDGAPPEARLRAERRRAHEPGLLALARLNRTRRDRLFADLATRWPEERRERLLRSVADLARALRVAGHAEGAETAAVDATIAAADEGQP